MSSSESLRANAHELGERRSDGRVCHPQLRRAARQNRKSGAAWPEKETQGLQLSFLRDLSRGSPTQLQNVLNS